MIKTKHAILAICLASISLSSPKSATERDIYFCTKDLDSLQSSPGFITGGNANNDGNINMQAYFPLENDQHNALNLRHCFVTFASIETRGSSILSLKQVKTYGYGANSNPNEHKKTGGAYQETDLQGKIVSCVPVLESSKLKGSEDIYDKWSGIMRIMDKEISAANYNTVGHNCCSVAYHAIQSVGGDLSNVDSSNFNLYGMGINWGQTVGNITDYLTVSTHSGIQFLATIMNFSSSKTQDVDLLPNQTKTGDL